MKKRFLVLSLSLLSVVSLSACESAPTGEDPQAVIDKAWEKLADKNAEYTRGHIELEGKASLEVEDSKGNISGSAEVMFDSEKIEESKSAIKMDVEADGTFSGSSGKVSLEGEVRNFVDKTYIYLEDLEIDTGDAQTNLMANIVGNLYKSKWTALPTGTFSPTDLPALEAERFRGKEVAEIAKNNNFFEVDQDLGDGKYQLKINPEKLKTYLREVSQVTENPLSEEDLRDVDAIFAELDYQLQVKIDSDYELTWIMGNLSAEDPVENQQMTLAFEGTLDDDESEGFLDLQLTGDSPGKLRVDFEAEHHAGGDVSIAVPEDAEDFDLGSLLGGGLPTGLPGDVSGGMPGGIPGGLPAGLPEGLDIAP